MKHTAATLAFVMIAAACGGTETTTDNEPTPTTQGTVDAAAATTTTSAAAATVTTAATTTTMAPPEPVLSQDGDTWTIVWASTDSPFWAPASPSAAEPLLSHSHVRRQRRVLLLARDVHHWVWRPLDRRARRRRRQLHGGRTGSQLNRDLPVLRPRRTRRRSGEVGVRGHRLDHDQPTRREWLRHRHQRDRVPRRNNHRRLPVDRPIGDLRATPSLASNDFRSPMRRRRTSPVRSIAASIWRSATNPRSTAGTPARLTLLRETAMNRAKSRSELLPQPCAMLEATDIVALRICETSPNRSSVGENLETRYTSRVRSIAFCQARYVLKSLISR